MLAAGTMVAAVAGWEWQGALEARQHQAFDLVSSEVGARVVTTLERNMDLLATAQGLVATNPNANNEDFTNFMTAVQASTRYKNSVAVVYIERVRQAQLSQFWASTGSSIQGTVGAPVVSPPGSRPQYCLLRASAVQITGIGTVSAGAAIPRGTDFCASEKADKVFQAAADSGASVVTTIQNGLSLTQASIHLPNMAALPGPARQAIGTLFDSDVAVAPVYRLGMPNSTISERQDALLGWAIDVLNTHSILRESIGQDGFIVTLSHRNPSGPSITLVRVGEVPDTTPYTQTIRTGPWILTLSGNPSLGQISPFAQGVFLGTAIFIMALLLFVLVWVLGRSRATALQLVDEKTGELAHQALHDALTGLPNRALILDRTEQMLARSRRQALQVGVLFIDLDNFKAINDGLGHAAGDRLLEIVGSRLSSVLRASDTVGRLGGDEFVVLVEADASDSGPELVAERLLDVLREPFHFEQRPGAPLIVTASIGIALGARDSAEEMLRDADLALYEAKDAGKNCYRLFRTDMYSAISERLELEMDLRDALEHDQLFLVYQPIFNLEHETIQAVEALLRWRHPTRGVISPETFIPIAEDTGLIIPIGAWVLTEACHQAAEWGRLGAPLGISVNVSARQLECESLVDDVRDALEASGLVPQELTLEITESTLMHDTEATARHLRVLKDLGVRLAIDDFGTGYSSLAYLQRFPVDALKIDRSFIAGISQSSEAGTLIRTLIQLGKTLHLETLAEGIEERAQLVELQRERCDTGQGFLFARPLDVESLENMIGLRSVTVIDR